MLGGGIPRGHAVTLLGSFGTGKTTVGLQFLWQGLREGDKGLYLSLEEDVDSLLDCAAGFGWDFRPAVKEKKVAILRLEPADLKGTLTQLKSEIPKFINDFGARRVVLDSVSLLSMLFSEESERRARLFSLAQQIKETGATTLFTSEVKDENSLASRDGIVEYLSDGVLSLQYREVDSKEIFLVIQVIKMRRMKHSRKIRPYRITDQGVEVLFDVDVV